MYQLGRLKDQNLGIKRAAVWLAQAEYDLKAAGLSINNKFNEWAAYQSEQAVEKALKAVILSAGFIPPRTHKLSILIGICNNLNRHFHDTKFAFRDLDSFTFIARYPFLIPGRSKTPHEQISKQDAEMLFNQASDLITRVKYILQNNKSITHKDEIMEWKNIQNFKVRDRLMQVIDVVTSEFDVESILLFGSYARNLEQAEQATIDLLILGNTDLEFLERIRKIREITKGELPTIEPLMYTQSEYKYMIEEEGEGFLENALLEGRLIYEKGKGILL